MAIWVKIRKMTEANETFYYEVFKQDYETIEFYMGIDKKNQLLLFYLTKDFNFPAKIIDFKNKKELVHPLENIPRISFTHALMQGLEALNSQLYPENLDFIA